MKSWCFRHRLALNKTNKKVGDLKFLRDCINKSVLICGIIPEDYK